MNNKTYLMMEFKPDYFYPVPEGSILRYDRHYQNPETKQWHVYLELIGNPIK